jgi:hypothetical protein
MIQCINVEDLCHPAVLHYLLQYTINNLGDLIEFGFRLLITIHVLCDRGSALKPDSILQKWKWPAKQCKNKNFLGLQSFWYG